VRFTYLRAMVWGLIVAVVCWSGVLLEAAIAEAPHSFPPATPESQGVATANVRRLADEVARHVKMGTIVGGELLIIKNRKTILHEVYGDRDREDKRRMERNTIFNVRSMTKPLTGVAIQILVDEGKIKLADPVAKYLPGFDNDKSRAITIEQLLEHRSGLPLTIMVILNGFKDLQAQADAAGKKGPQFKPGEKFWYSDAGSDCAAAIVEKVSGMKIDRFVSQRILEPLGMADSFYPGKADDPRKKRLASLYLGRPGNWTRFWKPGGDPMYTFAWGSQTLYSTPADYARFLTLWLDGGKVAGKKLLSKEAVTRILTPKSIMTTLGSDAPYPTGFDGMRLWYGQMSMLYVTGNDAKGKVIGFGHGGSDGTGAWAFPEEDLIVCYFTQSRGQLTTIRIESTIQDALLHPGVSVKVPDDLKPYLGTYYANFSHYKDAEFNIVFRNGHLALDIPDQLVFELKPPDKAGRWQFALTDAVSVSFKKDKHGKIVSMIIHQGGMTFELPRDKPVKPEPITKEAAEKYLGKYRRDEDKVVVEVSWKDGGLAIRAEGEKNALELVQRPDKKSWQPRQPSGAVTTFKEDKSGEVISFVTELPDGRKLTRHRVEE
jgi:CubicO group peptidase (beta-lactamase class C family)